MPYTLVRTLVQPLSYVQRLCLWQGALVAGGLLVWAQRRRQPGAPRLVLALALFPLNAGLPMMFGREAELFTVISIFISAAVTNTKARARMGFECSAPFALLRIQRCPPQPLPLIPWAPYQPARPPLSPSS